MERAERKNIFRIIIVAILALPLVFSTTTVAQEKNKLLREGNKLYEKGKYGEAEMRYRKSLEKDKEDVRGRYNLGDALYQQRKFDESARLFEGLTNSKDVDNITKAKTFHNLGNSFLEAKEYEKSIEAFKHALINNPSDKDTKYNLEYAKLMLKKQQQQQQQQKQQQKDQQKKDQDKKDQQKQDQQQQQDKKDQQQDPKKISKEDAERMLEALKNDEKKTMQKVRKEKVKSQQQEIIEKDW